MRKKIGAWILLLVCLLLLSFSATPYSNVANLTLIGVRVVLIIIVSVLALHERWKLRNDSSHRGTILRRMRGWYYGDEKDHR